MQTVDEYRVVDADALADKAMGDEIFVQRRDPVERHHITSSWYALMATLPLAPPSDGFKLNDECANEAGASEADIGLFVTFNIRCCEHINIEHAKCRRNEHNSNYGQNKLWTQTPIRPGTCPVVHLPEEPNELRGRGEGQAVVFFFSHAADHQRLRDSLDDQPVQHACPVFARLSHCT